MNTRLLLISFFFLLISCSNDNDDLNDNIDNDGNNITLFSNKARVVGYFPYYRFPLNNQIEYCKVTHLNIAFANAGITAPIGGSPTPPQNPPEGTINGIISGVSDNFRIG